MEESSRPLERGMPGKAPRAHRSRKGPGSGQLHISYYRFEGSNMRDLNKRLDGLEAALAPEGKSFMIWAMIGGRQMTDAETNATFQEAIASGRASLGDKPLAISWTAPADRCSP
jgi:hypothetical protein